MSRQQSTPDQRSERYAPVKRVSRGGNVTPSTVWHVGSPGDRFTRLPNGYLRDSGLTCEAKAIINVLASHSDGYVIRLSKVAEQCNLGEHRFRRHLAVALESRYLSRRPTGGVDERGNRTYRYLVDLADAEVEPESSQSATETPEAVRQNGVLPPRTSAPKQRTKKNTNSLEEHEPLSRSTQASTAEAVAAHHIPRDWQPNRTHYATIAKRRLDPDEVLAAFYDSDVVAAEKRTNWDRTYGGFILSFADGDEMRDYAVQY